jgi:hypothetical protein
MRHGAYKALTLSLAVAALASSVAWSPPAVAQVKTLDVARVQAPELRLEERNVVSAVLPEGERLSLEQIKKAPQTDWEHGEVKINSQGEVLLISRTIPAWFRTRFSESSPWMGKGLEEFRTRDVELKGTTATFSGEYNREAIRDVFTETFFDDSERGRPQYEQHKKRYTEILNSPQTKVTLGLTPSIYFYAESGEYLGATRIKEGQPNFKPRKTPVESLATSNWYHVPALIEPRIALRPQDAERAISLTPNSGVWTLKALASTLSAQGLKFEAPDGKLAPVSLYIHQPKSWTALELLEAVGAVTGVEVTRTENGYKLGTSPAHYQVAVATYDLIERRHEQQKNLNSLFEIFSRNGNRMVLPLDGPHFRHLAPVPLESFTPEQRTQLLAPLDEATRGRVGQVWPVLYVSVGVRSNLTGEVAEGTFSGGSIGTEIVPFPPNADLNPPAGWKGFDEVEFVKLHGATITP